MKLSLPADPSRRLLRTARNGLLFILLALAACSASDEAAQRAKAGAATATVQMVGQAWLSADVPLHYARRTAQAMRRQLASTAANDPDAAIGNEASVVGEVERELTASDRQSLERAIEQLNRAGTLLDRPKPRQ
jgi:hypothetical protein